MHIRTLFNPQESALALNVKNQRRNRWVMAIGNFDGVHNGHQALLQSLHLQALRLNAKTVVCVFEPQPLEYFAPNSAPPRIMGARQKIEALFSYGVQAVLLCKFNANVADLSPQEFLQTLSSHLPICGFTVGRDFRFGARRQGDVVFLQAYKGKFNFDVEVMDDFTKDEHRVSSSLIREHLRQHRFDLAAKALGAPFVFNGKITHGRKLAGTLGFPTANLKINRIRPLLNGVFVGKAYLPYTTPVQASIAGVAFKEGLPAIANCGYKPSLDGDVWQIEVHLLQKSNSFNEMDLYGQRLVFEPRVYLRAEQHFESIAELSVAIAADVKKAQLFFNLN